MRPYLFSLLLVLTASGIAEATSTSTECNSQVEVNAFTSLEELLESVPELKNAHLVKTAKWSFGKPQTGFEIYIPLIQSTIGTTDDYDTPEFANALKAWQKKKGYGNPNGVLDVNAFSFLREYWQGERNIDSTMPERNRVEIAVGDRYDPKRENSLSMVGEKTYTAYKKMIAAARKDGLSDKDLKIVSSNRSPARLKMLQKGSSWKSIGYTIAGKNSVHFSGRALDLYVGGEPVSSSDQNRMTQIQSKAYRWLVKNGTKFGFRNYFFEPWHWEFVGSDD